MREINLDITNRCSNKCPGCIRQKIDFKNCGRDITIKEIDMISDYFDVISFCGQISDPSHHPNFLDILKICLSKNKIVEVHIATSHQSNYWWNKAFLLSKNKNITWIFGIDGLPVDSHKYRVNQNGEKLFNQMIKCSKFGIRTVWQYIIFNYNENNIDECRNIASANNIIFSLVKSYRFKTDDMKKLKPSEKWVSTGIDEWL